MISGCSLSRKMLYYPQPLSDNFREEVLTNCPHAEEITVPIDDKIQLQGWMIQKNLRDLPTLIVFGGNGEEITHLVDDFEHHIDANVLLMNYRGYGGSTGSPKEKDLKSDAVAIYHYLLSHYDVHPKQVMTAGRSLGSGIAFHLAVKVQLAKVILVTPYDSIEKVACHYYPDFFVNLFLADKFKTIDLCPEYQANTLILATQQDEVIPFERTQNLYDHIQSPKQMLCVNSATHNSILKFDEAWQAMAQFVVSNDNP